jgi:hypothetical protein
MSQKEMKDLNNKMYNNIPDVKNKRNNEKKKEELVERIETTKSYGKVYLTNTENKG